MKAQAIENAEDETELEEIMKYWPFDDYDEDEVDLSIICVAVVSTRAYDLLYTQDVDEYQAREISKSLDRQQISRGQCSRLP
nr:hypothetical protein CFP56_66537 [Quercus suber]